MTMTTQQIRLSFKEKLSYGLGDFGNGFMFDLGQAYLNPPGESGDSTLIETMLLHRYSSRYRRFAPISRAAYLRSIHTGAGC